MLPILKDYSELKLMECLLTEKFDLTVTEYGTDLYNHEFEEVGNIIRTFFKFEDKFIMIAYSNDTGEFGYGISKTFDKDSEYIDQPDLGVTTKSFLKLLNMVFYMFFELTKHTNIVYMFIKMPNKQKLDTLYDHVFSNSSFKRVLTRYNFRYELVPVGKLHEFQFTRIKVKANE